MDEFLPELLTLLLAALALLLSRGKVWVNNIESQNKQNEAVAQLDLLRQEIETLRDKTDLETQELVNSVMQRFVTENSELQERIRTNEMERASLETKLEILSQQFETTKTEFQTRINELEATILEKDKRIAELERRVVSLS